MADILNADTFIGREGERFTIHVNDSESLDTELIEVSVYDRPGQYSFSVVFRGPADRYAPQGIYKLSHDKLGEHQMYIGPITYPSTETGIYYEFCVNRLIESDA